MIKTGFALYLGSGFDKNKEVIKKASKAKMNTVFTSLHIPEELVDDYNFEVKKLLAECVKHNLNVMVDVSNNTIDKLKINSLTELKEWGFSHLRIDFGISLEEIIELSKEFYIVLNTSTITQTELETLKEMGVVGAYLLSALFLPLVSVGLHQALTPIHQLLNDPAGATEGINYLLPILMMSGGGQVGAGFALYLKSKNRKVKSLTRDSMPVGILGIGEPMMYAVTLPLGRPFITACLGAGFGGVAARIFELGAVSQGISGLFGALIVQPGNQINFYIAMLIAYIGRFVLTWFFGVDDKRADEVYS